jgi:hypothetical protein
METAKQAAKETKDRERRLSTNDVATADEDRERNVEDRRDMNDPIGESVRVTDARASGTGEGLPQPASVETPPLMKTEDEENFRSRWNGIQTGFVDEPRRAVEQADELVAELMQHLARSFSDQRTNLETQWQRSEQVSTEELRGALRRYRSFFDRLLSI